MLLLLDLLATLCFACTGALIALNARMRTWQVLLAAMLSAIGGGTTRDLLLGSGELFWLANLNYLVAIGLAIPSAVLLFRFQSIAANTSRSGALSLIARWVDSIATTVFVVVGVLAAMQSGCNMPCVVLAGLFTGVGGGLIRQLLLETEVVTVRNGINITAAFSTALFCALGLQANADLLIVLVVLGGFHFTSSTCLTRIARTMAKFPSGIELQLAAPGKGGFQAALVNNKKFQDLPENGGNFTNPNLARLQLRLLRKRDRFQRSKLAM